MAGHSGAARAPGPPPTRAIRFSILLNNLIFIGTVRMLEDHLLEGDM
ncbi:hypothetical protein [Actinomadura sp. 9N407]